MYPPWAPTQAATTLEVPHPSAPPVQLVAKSFDDPAPTPPLSTVVEPLPEPAQTATETAVSRAPSDSASAPSRQATDVRGRQRSQHKPRREVERGAPEPQAAANEAPRRALDTTNLRELASATSTVIGEVRKGSTFRVIGRSDDGKWLKIETRDGLTGYYWAARAREMR
jgi:SH3 domain-containing protein